MEDKLKVVVLVDDLLIQKWMYLALERIVKSSHSVIVLIVMNNSEGIYKSRWQKLFNNLHKVIYFSFASLEAFCYRLVRGQGARELMPLDKLLPDIPVQGSKPLQGKFTDEFSDEAIAEIRKYEPDVVIRFGFRILKGDILDVARFGVVSFHHGDPDIFRGGPACYWESALAKRKTGSILQVLSSDLDGGFVLRRSYTATNIFSPYLNYESALLSSVPFLDDSLREIYNTRELTRTENPLPYYDGIIFTAPHNLLALKHIFLFAKRVVSRLVEKAFWFDQWVILYGKKDELNVRKFVKFAPEHLDRFWADPFLLKQNDRQYLFFEEQIGSNPAHIAVGEIVDGELKDIEPVLVEGYHLSYPFIFWHEDSLYMIPESTENKSVDLYRCESFPSVWVKIKTLMADITAADTTVFFKDDYWWLFSSIREHSGSCPHSSLRLFYSRDLLHADFVPHANNPICSDVSKSRPAGMIFHWQNEIYRPSQDCAIRYGYAVNFNRITTLTPSDYKESSVGKINPHWDSRCLGVHTYNSDNSHVVLDALIKRRRFFGG